MRATLLLLLAAVPVTGCLDALTGAFNEEDPPVAPAPLTFEGLVTPGLRRTENFTVPAGMAAVSLALELRLAGSPNDSIPPIAQLEVQVFSSDGQAVSERRTLSPQARTGSIDIGRPAPGELAIQLSGNGLAGNGQGASYRITVTQTAQV